MTDDRRAYLKAWRAANRDRRREQLRAWRAVNPGKAMEYNARFYEKHTDRERARTSAYKRANPEWNAIAQGRHKARKIAAAGSHSLAEWQAIVAKYGGCCARCHEKKKLSRDHIIPLSRGGSDFAFNIQPLCGSCNSRKRASVARGAQHSLFDRLTA